MLRMKKPKRRTVVIPGRICEMARGEIVEAVGADAMASLKKTDPHPQLVAMSVGHEGVSTGSVEGRGRVEKIWSDEAIGQLARRVEGAAVYLNHQADGGARLSHGRVLKGLVKTMGRRRHAVAIAHITTPHTRRQIAEGKLDACSIEADCLFAPAAEDRWVVRDVKKVTGVALASAQFFKTGFRHAGVLAAVQEFEEQEAPTVEDVRDAVRELHLAPDQVFEPQQILSTAFVRDAIENEVDARRQEKADELRDARRQVTTLEKELAPVREKVARARMSTLIDDSPHLKDAERTLVGFLKDNLPLPKNGPPDRAAVDKLVEKELERIRQYGITFGSDTPDKDKGLQPLAPADSATGADYTSPKHNDLIPR